MTTSGIRPRTLATFALILLVALGLRLYRLDHRPLSQAEAYTPGIEFPPHVTEPRQRMTWVETIFGTHRQDVHPPGYYLMMVGWSKRFGVELRAMRAPSVLFGVLSIAALFFLARREAGDGTALLASAMLAGNGLHLFYSQRARMWILAVLLAVLSIQLLLRLERRHGRAAAAAYVAVCAVGLWTVYPFWALLIAQGAYVWLGRPRLERTPDLLRLQGAAAVLASPALVFMLAQAPRSHSIASSVWLPLLDIAAFDGMLDLRALFEWHFPLGAIVCGIALAAGASLLVLGSRSRRAVDSCAGPRVFRDAPDDTHAAWILPAALSVSLAILAGLRLIELCGARRFAPAIAFALSVVGICWALGRNRDAFFAFTARVRSPRGVRAIFGDPSTGIVVGFALLLLGASLVLKPVIVPRALLLVAAPCMLLVARGGAALPGRALRGAVAAALVGVAILSSGYALTDQRPPIRGYAEISKLLAPRLQEGDQLVVANKWWAQPVFYYVDFGRFPASTPDDLIARLEAGTAASADPRLWVFAWAPGDAIDAETAAVIRPFLALGFEPVEQLDARWVRAVLLQRRGARNGR